MSKTVCDQYEVLQAIEDNILALADTVGVKEPEDIEDDKMSFLEAVYALPAAPDAAGAPTRRIYEAIFAILEENLSVGLNLASYFLLVELDKHYPRVNVEELLKLSSSAAAKGLAFENEIWSPFSGPFDKLDKSSKIGIVARSSYSNKCDYEAFVTLLEGIANETDTKQWMQTDSGQGQQAKDGILHMGSHQIVGLVLRFKYFTHEIEQDFKIRYDSFKVTQNMDCLTDSFLIQIFKGPRRKALVSLLLRLLARSCIYNDHKGQDYCFEEHGDMHSVKVQTAVMDLNKISSSVQSLLLMIMDFDVEYGKRLESSPKQTKQEGNRISIWDLISDIIGYEKFLLAPLLQVLENPVYKMRVIFNYFIRNAPQPIVKDLREKRDKATVEDFLNCFAQSNDARNIYRSIETDILQLLLAHAFNAFVMQYACSQHYAPDVTISGICKLLMSAFENIQTISGDFELHSAGRQALITAEVISSHMAVVK
eukprot:c26646_g1_i2 orf=791-2233(-)